MNSTNPKDLSYYQRNRDKVRSKCRERYANNVNGYADRVRRETKNRKMKVRYGISYKEYETLYQKAKGCCEICGTLKDRLDIDHCHNTGKIRGVLCNSCNTGLGLFKDNAETLENAGKYLRHNEPKGFVGNA